MIDWSQIERVVSVYGLPLAILIVLGWLVITERLVTGASATRREQSFKDLYEQEREDHRDTKRRLDRSIRATEEAADLAGRYESLVRERLSS